MPQAVPRRGRMCCIPVLPPRLPLHQTLHHITLPPPSNSLHPSSNSLRPSSALLPSAPFLVVGEDRGEESCSCNSQECSWAGVLQLEQKSTKRKVSSSSIAGVGTGRGAMIGSTLSRLGCVLIGHVYPVRAPAASGAASPRGGAAPPVCMFKTRSLTCRHRGAGAAASRRGCAGCRGQE